MNASTNTGVVTPPKIFKALQTGFDQTTRHLGLILFPILLDLLLWLGPQMRIKGLFQPLLDGWMLSTNRGGSPELQALVAQNQAGLQLFIDRYNLFTILPTFPIGIPSLMAGRLHEQTPLGTVIALEFSDLSTVIIASLAIILVGLTIGGLFFALIAREYQTKKLSSFRELLRQVVGTYSLTLMLLLILVVLLIPTIIILTIVGLFSLELAQFVAMVIVFFSIWLLLPLTFAAHGIFSSEQNPIVSLLSSIRLVRGFMPGTGLFLITSIVVNEGLNIIWNFAESQSWMTMVGILGHGFVVTSLISASFAYYRSGITWMNDAVMRSMKKATNAV